MSLCVHMGTGIAYLPKIWISLDNSKRNLPLERQNPTESKAHKMSGNETTFSILKCCISLTSGTQSLLLVRYFQVIVKTSFLPVVEQILCIVSSAYLRHNRQDTCTVQMCHAAFDPC